MYFRIFRETFGDLSNLSWMGRTKKAPARTLAATEEQRSKAAPADREASQEA